MADSQTELKASKRTSTMPTPPSPKKSGNFFKRAFTASGKKPQRRSSASFPNAHSPEASPRPQSQAQQQPPTTATHEAPVSDQKDGQAEHAQLVNGVPKRVTTDSSTATANDSAIAADYAAAADPPLERPETPTVIEPEPAESEEDAPAVRQDSRSRVKWAEGVDEQSLPPRPRRTSSGVSRRPSIFTRREEGVDAGVGSKARRFSVAVSEDVEFEVNEVPLQDHFGMVSRLNKKSIGEGGAATVNLMTSKTVSEGKTKDKVFAVKEFRDWDEAEESQRDYTRKIKSEFAIAKSLEHPNIVETYKLCHSDHMTKWYHVMEYCDQGDMNDIINKQFFSREDRNCMFKQLIRGIEYLHSRGIAHRDLKSENLLLTKNGCLKIADFGTSEVFSGNHPGARRCRRPSLIDQRAEIRFSEPGLVGSRPYMAPEILAHEHPYDPRAADVWSCGIVYISLIMGATPWQAACTDIKNYNIYVSSWEKFYEKYGKEKKIGKEGPFPSFAATMMKSFQDAEMVALVLGMLHPNPLERTTASEALENPTVVEFACCQQDGYSDDIKKRQRKAMHNHIPPKKLKGGLIGSKSPG